MTFIASTRGRIRQFAGISPNIHMWIMTEFQDSRRFIMIHMGSTVPPSS